MKNLKSPLLPIVLAIISLNLMNAFAQIPKDILKNVPVECQHITVLNMKQIAESPLYKATTPNGRQLIGAIPEDIALFAKLTGIDPVRDVSYIVLSNNLMIANGRFDKKQIRRYIESRTDISEFKAADPFAITGLNLTPMEIVFLTESQIAVGSDYYVASAFRTRHSRLDNFRSNPAMAKLIGSIPTNAMIWFVGKWSPNLYALEKTPVPIPSGPFNSNIKGVTGYFDITNEVVGDVTLITSDSKSAETLTDFYVNLDAAAKIIEGPSVVKWLAEGLKSNRIGSKINLSLNYSKDALERIRDWSNLPANSADLSTKLTDSANSKNDLKNPISIFGSPLISYTEAARKAGVQGTIRLQTTVRSNGTSDNIKVLNGLGYGLDEAAVNLVRNKFLWIPALLNGKPVSALANIEFTLRLYNSARLPIGNKKDESMTK